MKKIIAVSTLIILTAAFIFITKHQPDSKTGSDNRPLIKVGVSFPMTGPMGIFGKPMQGALKLAEQDIQKQNTRYRYQFILEDNAFETKKAVLINQKFLNIDKVDALIDYGSRIGLATSPEAEKNKIIHLSSCASNPAVANGKYNFIHWTQPDAEASRLIQKVKKDGFQNVVIISALDQAMDAIAAELIKNLQKYGINFSEKKVNPEEKDFNLLIDKLEKEKPDLYILNTFSPSLEIIIKRMNEKGIKTPRTSIEAFSFIDDKSIIEGQWYVDIADLDSDNYQRFTEYNQSDNTFGIGNVYDAVMLLVKAFEQAADKSAAVDELSDIKKYRGVVGNLKQDENGIFHTQAVVKKIIKGKPQVMKD